METLLEQFINELVRNIRAVENNTATHISVSEFCTLLIRSLTIYKTKFNWWQRMVVDIVIKQLLAFVVKAEKTKLGIDQADVILLQDSPGVKDNTLSYVKPSPIQRRLAIEDSLDGQIERLDTLKHNNANESSEFLERLELDRLALEGLQNSISTPSTPQELTPFEKQLRRNEEILKERIAANQSVIPTL